MFFWTIDSLCACVTVSNGKYLLYDSQSSAFQKSICIKICQKIHSQKSSRHLLCAESFPSDTYDSQRCLHGETASERAQRLPLLSKNRGSKSHIIIVIRELRVRLGRTHCVTDITYLSNQVDVFQPRYIHFHRLDFTLPAISTSKLPYKVIVILGPVITPTARIRNGIIKEEMYAGSCSILSLMFFRESCQSSALPLL